MEQISEEANPDSKSKGVERDGVRATPARIAGKLLQLGHAMLDAVIKLFKELRGKRVISFRKKKTDKDGSVTEIEFLYKEL